MGRYSEKRSRISIQKEHVGGTEKFFFTKGSFDLQIARHETH